MTFILKTTGVCFVIVLIIRCIKANEQKENNELKENNEEKQTFVQDGLGNYNSSYQNEEQNRTEVGEIVKSELNETSLVVHGSYSNTFNRGRCQKINVTYIADDRGFRATFFYKAEVVYSVKYKMNILKCKGYKSGTVGGEAKNISSAALSALAGSGIG